MSEEVYNNLSVKEIAKLLKEKIENGRPFKVTFTSEFPIFVSISYTPKTRFTLKVEQSLGGKILDKEETNIRVPDQFIHGFGTLGITPLGIGFDISGYGTKITVYREKITEKYASTSLNIWGR